MTYMVISIADLICVYRLAEFDHMVVAGGIFILPFMYFFEDIIAEVYGYARARQAIWSMLFACVIFSAAMTMEIHLPAPKNWHYAADYSQVFEHVFRTTFGGGCIAIVTGGFINTIIVSRWRVLWRGRYFMIRSLASTAIGQAIQNILGAFVLYTGILPFQTVLKMIAPLYAIQMTISFILIFPGYLMVQWLKRAENVTGVLGATSYNPFSLKLE